MPLITQCLVALKRLWVNVTQAHKPYQKPGAGSYLPVPTRPGVKGLPQVRNAQPERRLSTFWRAGT